MLDISKLRLQLFSLALALILMTAGCLSPKVMLNSAVVRNATHYKITDVRVRHDPTGKIATTNQILPDRSLEIGFSEKPMLASHATLSWQDHRGQEMQERVVLPQVLGSEKSDRVMSLVYVIGPGGVVSVSLRGSEVLK